MLHDAHPNMMDSSVAVRSHPQGCVISFEIVPGSTHLEVPSGFNPWRKSFEAHLTEEPLRGKANRQLIQTLAKTLGISDLKVELLTGQRSAKKVVLVRGLSRDEAICVLSKKIK
jgi:uncharacterized protein (TIGR00251 family)